MSFTVRRHGWEHFGDISINKSTVGPQGAEAMIFWTSFPVGRARRPLRPPPQPARRILGRRSGVRGLDGARDRPRLGAFGRHRGTGGTRSTWSSSSSRTSDAIPATSSRGATGRPGALWPSTNVGDTIRVWIVQVHGTVLFIEAETTTQANAATRARDRADRPVDPVRVARQLLGTCRTRAIPETVSAAPTNARPSSYRIPRTSYAATGLPNPFSSTSPTGSVRTASSTAANTLGPIRVCPADACVLSRDARFATEPSAA